MILEQLGIYGWKERDENLILSSLLTGDPLLLIGNHGCAKTHLANKMGLALGKKFIVYDASKAMFEDVLGYPNIEKLKQGIIEYVPSPVTIWDKELVLIDELNRAIPELQSKWLEIIRSRKIMGFTTQVKWVWSAMNPMTYSATQALDEALIGRFALFIYPPDVLQMNEVDRIRVTQSINGDDAPSLNEWMKYEKDCDGNGRKAMEDKTRIVGKKIQEILFKSAQHFNHLREELSTLSEFLAKFADLLLKETNGEIALDGRRLGFIYRNILANHSIELAKNELYKEEKTSFKESSKYVIESSIPIGLNDESIKKEEIIHKMEICFDLLSNYFDKSSEMDKVNRIYELFTTKDIMRKTEILLKEDLGDFAKSKAWTNFINDNQDITLLAYTALQVEALRPNTIPQELLESLNQKISQERLSTDCIPKLKGDSIEYIEEIEALLNQETDLAKIVAYNRVKELAEKENIMPDDINATQKLIDEDIHKFNELIQNGR